MFTKRIKNNIVYYTSPLFDKLEIPHLFASRFGGVSSGAFDSLNVSTSRKDGDGFTDLPERVEENYTRALSLMGVLPQNCVAAKQIHTDNILYTSCNDKGKGICRNLPEMPGCDGLVAQKGGEIQAVCVKTADCVPILLKNVKTGDVCAVHAGWRGTVSDISGKAAKMLSTDNGKDIVAAIGPCIGRCCYEIGGEVYSSFEVLMMSKDRDFDMNMLFTLLPDCSMGGRTYLDLARANKTLLMFAGVREENIDVSGICTCCYTDNGVHPFFSHRGQGGFSGTFVSAIAL